MWGYLALIFFKKCFFPAPALFKIIFYFLILTKYFFLHYLGSVCLKHLNHITERCHLSCIYITHEYAFIISVCSLAQPICAWYSIQQGTDAWVIGASVNSALCLCPICSHYETQANLCSLCYDKQKEHSMSLLSAPGTSKKYENTICQLLMTHIWAVTWRTPLSNCQTHNLSMTVYIAPVISRANWKPTIMKNNAFWYFMWLGNLLI